MSDTFAQDLVPVRGQALERGEAVYEIVRYGKSDSDVKLKKLRVLDTDRGSALVEPYDGTPGERKAQQRRVQFTHLRMEPRAEAKLDTRPRVKLVPAASETLPATKPAPAVAPKTSDSDGQFEAWKEMGLGLVADIKRDIATLGEQHAKISGDLEALDTRHRRTIEELERELLEARRAHEEDRALTARLERAKERLKGIKSMLGESADV
jgi:hypothetical protein